MELFKITSFQQQISWSVKLFPAEKQRIRGSVYRQLAFYAMMKVIKYPTQQFKTRRKLSISELILSVEHFQMSRILFRLNGKNLDFGVV